ncbi:helix-turn-helix transcriptional regulator [Halorarum salinum]|uniref:Winged helix-turn-helix transcriptional regulator n=1 Tax=Halorarum salinum TaxID=2743089 RepID=A0A7D5QAJ2_9EURY|nr:winged helix-turn-helix domain-containing protein [Halobaculum salinum]QLG61499.1 winged helix-turn-helix transcriptional regulator [Halobaculum salinum]
MSSPDAAEVAPVLARRRECLRALTDGPVRKRDLVDSLDMPRTTLDRAVRELTEAGLVERVSGAVRATGFGREALAAADEYRDTLDGLADASPLLDALPAATPLGAAFLRGARVSVATPPAPDRVVDDLFDSVADADSVRGVAPAALAGHMASFREHASSDGAVPELHVTPAVLRQVVEVRGGAAVESLRRGELDLLSGPVPFDFGLWLADDAEAGVVVYTDTGIRGVAVNDAGEALAWAREQYERVAERGEAVAPEHVADMLDEDRHGASPE